MKMLGEVLQKRKEDRANLKRNAGNAAARAISERIVHLLKRRKRETRFGRIEWGRFDSFL